VRSAATRPAERLNNGCRMALGLVLPGRVRRRIRGVMMGARAAAPLNMVVLGGPTSARRRLDLGHAGSGTEAFSMSEHMPIIRYNETGSLMGQAGSRLWRVRIFLKRWPSHYMSRHGWIAFVVVV
jgi:hypothetical protein